MKLGKIQHGEHFINPAALHHHLVSTCISDRFLVGVAVYQCQTVRNANCLRQNDKGPDGLHFGLYCPFPDHFVCSLDLCKSPKGIRVRVDDCTFLGFPHSFATELHSHIGEVSGIGAKL